MRQIMENLLALQRLELEAYTNEVHFCDNCGRYLYLLEDEPLGLTDSPPIKAPAKSRARRTRQKVDLQVA